MCSLPTKILGDELLKVNENIAQDYKYLGNINVAKKYAKLFNLLEI